MIKFNSVDVYLKDGSTAHIRAVESLYWWEGRFIVCDPDTRHTFPVSSIQFIEEFQSV